MVDPDALHTALGQKLEQQRVHVMKHALLLDPHPDQARSR